MTSGGMKVPARSAGSGEDEEVVVTAAAGGDARAFATLYRRYQPYVAKIVTSDVRDSSAWADLEQAVFERAWTKLEALRDPSAFRPWLAQITRRLIVDHHRQTARTICTDFTDEQYDMDSAEWSAHDWSTVRELADTLRIAIDGLSPRDATVIELASSFGFNASEIAAALDVEQGHARVLLHRARARLSRELLSVRGSTEDGE